MAEKEAVINTWKKQKRLLQTFDLSKLANKYTLKKECCHKELQF